VLDARQAVLAALGPSAALAGEPLRYAVEGEPALDLPPAAMDAIAARARLNADHEARVLPLTRHNPAARSGRYLYGAAGLGPAR
jgi:hypothetical protein